MTISFTDPFTLSAWPLGRCRSLTPVEVPSQVWQDGVAMNDSENQFSITRVVPSTSGRAKTKFLTVTRATSESVPKAGLPQSGLVVPLFQGQRWILTSVPALMVSHNPRRRCSWNLPPGEAGWLSQRQAM